MKVAPAAYAGFVYVVPGASDENCWVAGFGYGFDASEPNALIPAAADPPGSRRDRRRDRYRRAVAGGRRLAAVRQELVGDRVHIGPDRPRFVFPQSRLVLISDWM